MKYRAEIDGLRALAVIPVILFHANLLGVTGGFIGVDIFFVISGYLITNILIEEIENNRFSILNFYERRARRILPALSIVLLLTTLAAYVLMPPNLLVSYSQSLVSVASFLSNMFFYLTNGYFSTASDEKPLLHTWSLAVEEQYYIFFPILISALWFIGKKQFTILISILALASLAFSQYLCTTESTDANFYLIFSRAWELFAGSLIATTGVQQLSYSRATKELLSWLGIFLILYAIFFFDRNTPFPSIYALIPVIGSACIIIFADSHTVIGQFLMNKLFVSIGLISYSLYLWHQPLFAFLRLKTLGEPSQIMFIAAIFAAVILAGLSYRYIETPFRNKKTIPRKVVWRYSIISIGIFLLIGFSGHFAKGFPGRFHQLDALKIAINSAKPSPKRAQCHTRGVDFLKPEDACHYFNGETTWASFGDSHTVEIAYALAEKLKTSNEALLHLSFSGCPPALLFEVKHPGCTKWIEKSLIELESNKSIKNVLIGFRYSAFLYGEQMKTYPNIPNEDPSIYLTDSSLKKINSDVRNTYWESLNAIIKRLLNAGKHVYVLYPIPELPTHIMKIVTPFSIFNKHTRLDIHKTTRINYYLSRNHFILNKLNTLPYSDNLIAIKPFEILCTESHCPALKNQKALYFDDDHISVEGARLILENSVIANIINR